jgi:ribonuclease T2
MGALRPLERIVRRESLIKRTHVAALLLFTVMLAATAVAKKHHKPAPPQGGNFDYYVLSLSWAPNYCAGHPSDHSAECKVGGHVAFVLHGLWPQASAGQPPLSCGNVSPVSAETVRHMLEYFPDRGMVQHEWEKHGSCSGLAADEYFGKVEQAFKSIKVPDQFRTLDQSQTLPIKQIEKAFADANNAPANAFRVSCHAGELVNLEACVDKDLKYQACTQSVHECSSSQLLMRGVR